MRLQERVDPRLEPRRQRVGARVRVLYAGQVRVVEVLEPQQRLVEGRGAYEEVAAVPDQGLAEVLGREARHEHALHATHEHGVVHTPKP